MTLLSKVNPLWLHGIDIGIQYLLVSPLSRHCCKSKSVVSRGSKARFATAKVIRRCPGVRWPAGRFRAFIDFGPIWEIQRSAAPVLAHGYATPYGGGGRWSPVHRPVVGVRPVDEPAFGTERTAIGITSPVAAAKSFVLLRFKNWSVSLLKNEWR